MNNSKIYRSFTEDDIPKVLEIYNYYISNGLENFEEKPLSAENFLKLYKNIILNKLPFIVCESNNQILGFAYLNNFRKKSGYKFSFEDTIYIDKKFSGKGIGTKLLSALIESSKKNTNIKTIIAVIGGNEPNASIAIHKKQGFNIIGVLKKVGFKNNQWLDAVYMQKIVNDQN